MVSDLPTLSDGSPTESQSARGGHKTRRLQHPQGRVKRKHRGCSEDEAHGRDLPKRGRGISIMKIGVALARSRRVRLSARRVVGLRNSRARTADVADRRVSRFVHRLRLRRCCLYGPAREARPLSGESSPACRPARRSASSARSGLSTHADARLAADLARLDGRPALDQLRHPRRGATRRLPHPGPPYVRGQR